MRQSPDVRTLSFAKGKRAFPRSFAVLDCSWGDRHGGLGGCTALSTVQGGVDRVNSTASSTKSTAEQTKALGTDLKNTVTGKNPMVLKIEQKEDDDGKRILAKQTRLNQPVGDELNVTK